MAVQEIKEKNHMKSDKDSDLNGTLTSVFLLGLFLIITWVSIYSLFVDRLG